VVAHTVYKRGIGEVRVVHNSYEVAERELSCRYALPPALSIPSLFSPQPLSIPVHITLLRALYQYLLDIPEVSSSQLISLAHNSVSGSLYFPMPLLLSKR
jgi:hypothetical protein